MDEYYKTQTENKSKFVCYQSIFITTTEALFAKTVFFVSSPWKECSSLLYYHHVAKYPLMAPKTAKRPGHCTPKGPTRADVFLDLPE